MIDVQFHPGRLDVDDLLILEQLAEFIESDSTKLSSPKPSSATLPASTPAATAATPSSTL